MNNQFGTYGDDFQQKSKYIRDKLPRHQLDWTIKPKPFKTYPDALKTIKLPDPDFDKEIRFWQVVFPFLLMASSGTQLMFHSIECRTNLNFFLCHHEI